MAAIAAIMVAILAAIFNMTRHFQIAFVTITFLMWEKPYNQFSLKLEHFEILRILVAIFKMTAILKSHWSQSYSSKNP
jgi:hypothetical protein